MKRAVHPHLLYLRAPLLGYLGAALWEFSEGVVARARGVGEVEATRDLVVDRKRVPRLCRDRLVVEAAEALLLSFVVNLDLPLPRRFVPLFKRKAG